MGMAVETGSAAPPSCGVQGDDRLEIVAEAARARATLEGVMSVWEAVR